MQYRVTVQIDGEDVPCGTLFQNVRHGDETTTFSYERSYLQDPRAFGLCPDMPLGPGTFHSSGLRQLRALEDCMPDRWGRNLLLRAERSAARQESRAERTLFETDMLVGVSDRTRQGAIRLWDVTDGAPLSHGEEGVPREVSLPHLLDAADLSEKDLDADVRDLVAAGSSLGGARPKASVLGESGELLVAKFPKATEGGLDDVCAWEHVCLRLMADSGICVPSSRLVRIKGRSVLLLGRFDRRGGRRVPYISGLTAVQGDDGNRYSYLELAEYIEGEGAQPERDLRELWARALFSCVVGNTDNHLRNYGFLRNGPGWVLSPAFDVNPTPGGGEKYLATSLDFDRPEADARLAIEVAEYFRMDGRRQAECLGGMSRSLRRWAGYARADGISEASISRMRPSFERGIGSLERCMRGL